MADEKKHQTIQEEAGLPENWVPIDVPPIIPGRPTQSEETARDGSSKFLQGTLPPGYQHDVSFVGAGYKKSTVPSLDLMPLGPSANANANAASQNIVVVSGGSSTPSTPDVESVGVNVQTGTSYSVLPQDNDTLISMTNNAGGTIILPAGASGGNTSMTWVQSAAGDGLGAGAGKLLPIACTTGNTIVVIATASNLDNITDVPVTSVTDSLGNSYTKLGGVLMAASGSGQLTNVSLWVSTNITGGLNNTVTAHTAIGSFFCMIAASEYTPSSAFIFDGLTTMLGTGSPTVTSAITTTGGNDLLLAAGYGYSNSLETFTAGSGYTMRAQFSDNITIDAQMGLQDRITTSVGSFSAAMSVAPDFGFPLVLFAIKLTGAPGILLPTGFYCWVENTGTGTFIVSSPANIDGANQTVSLGPNQGSLFVFDGFNWFTERGIGLATPVTVPNGGTGRTTLTAHAVLLGEGTSPVNFASPGAAGQILTSNGAGVDPTFQAPAPSVTFVVDINSVGTSTDKKFFMNGVTDGAAVWGVAINGVSDGG